jgi:cytochrome c-type biogenesis protein CcmE
MKYKTKLKLALLIDIVMVASIVIAVGLFALSQSVLFSAVVGILIGLAYGLAEVMITKAVKG